MTARNRMTSLMTMACSIIVLSGMVSSLALAGAREQAKQMHDRLAGVPPSVSVLNDMADDISNGNELDAAFTAMSDSAFYDVTLKNFAAPWTNEAMSKFVPLNDYIATVIGIVRDDQDFRKILFEDVLYIGDPSLGLPPYSVSNNNHYSELESRGISLRDNLIRVSQSSYSGLPSSATAGVITSQIGRAHV